MYWPTDAASSLRVPAPLNRDPIIAIRSSRRGNFFASLSKTSLGVWDVRPTVLQAAIVRTEESLKRWGENVDVFWSSDGRGLIILTSTSHLLVYQLVGTSQPVYDYHANSAFPATFGAGEGDVLLGWTIRPLGAAFIMGGVTTILAQPHHLIFGLRHPPSLLTVPWPLPTACVSPPGSHFPPSPLDGGGPGHEDIDQWDLAEAKEWLSSTDEGGTVPTGLSISRTQGLPPMFTLTTQDGRAYVMYNSRQVAAQSTSNPSTPLSRPSPSPLPPHQSSPVNYFSLAHPSCRYTGHTIHPLPEDIDADGAVDGTAALGLVEGESPAVRDSTFAPATRISVNSRFSLVAIGTADGDVQVVSVPTAAQPPRFSHCLSLKRSATLRHSVGAVRALAWTSDGYSLAVGYATGWAIWSVSGRLNGWAVNSSDDDEGDLSGDGLNKCVNDLFWTPGNLKLFVLSPRDGEPVSDQIHLVPFAKSATTGQHSPDNTRYAFLQMDDRVMVYRGADQPDMSVINPQSDVWQHIKVEKRATEAERQIPDSYMAYNWPIRYASISSDGRFIAVAGRRGLTHYSVSSGRWKLFVDERQERDFVVRGGLLWFQHVLVAAVDVDKTHQIRMYSRETDLADQHILHSHSVAAPVLVMSLLDNSLLVYTADNTLYHFLITPTVDSVKLHLCGSISFAGIVAAPTRVRALSWLVPQAQKEMGDPSDDLIVATIIFLVDGRLVLLRPRRAENDEVRYDMQVLADRIESYWTHLHGVGTLENSLWGYDGSAMRVWLDALTIEATRVDATKDAYETVKESIHLDLDFYPLSILMDKGIIIGVDFEASSRNLPFALFKIQTGTHLFLPPFLRYHLSRRNLHSALAFAVNYSSIVYFAHALEILLHSVLEDEMETGVKLLPLVIDFLDHFQESLDVVVGCARKIELERWELLFGIVGKPRDLFEKCLEEGRLKTAAGYLLVLQNLEELDDVKDTVRLLRLAMTAKETQLCKDLLRFLSSVDDTGDALRAAIAETGLKLPGSSLTRPSPIIEEASAPPPTNDPSSETDRPIDQANDHTDVPSNEQPHVPSSCQSAELSNVASGNSPSSQSNDPTSHSMAPSSSSSSYQSLRPGLLRHLSSHNGSPLRADSSGPISSPFQLSSPRMWMSPPSPRTVEPTATVPDQPSVPTPDAVDTPPVD